MNTTTTDIEQNLIRTALLSIVEQRHGVLNPRDIVEAAREPTHVLHGHFEWNDSAAADAYRLAQAGALIRRVRLTVVRPGRDPRSVEISTTRGYQSRPSMRNATGGYEPIDVILGDEHKRGELFAQVVRELSAYRKRYAELNELQAVWLAIDEATEELNSSAAPADETRPGAAG